MTFTFEEVAGKRAKRGGGTPQPVNTRTPSPPAPQGGFRAGNRVQLAANFDGQGKGITDVGSAITKQGQDILSLAEAREQAIFEGELKIKDKQDKNATNELVDVFDSFTTNSLSNADTSSLDFSNGTVVQQFNKTIADEAEKALNDPRAKDMSATARLDLEDRIRATVQKSQDAANGRSLTILNHKGENRFNTKAANLQDETAVNKIFDEGGDATQYFINSFTALAEQSIGSVDFKTQAKFQRNALQLAQNTVFNYHMRNNDIEAAEDTLEDGKFDAVDGSITNQANRKRIRDARSAPTVVRWDSTNNRNINISQAEADKDPNRYMPKKDMTKIDNLNSYRRELAANAALPEGDPSRLESSQLAQTFGIEKTEQDKVDSEVAAMVAKSKVLKEPEEQKKLLDMLITEYVEKAAPPSEDETARRKVRATLAEAKEKVKIINELKANQEKNKQVLEVIQEAFSPTENFDVAASSSIRRQTTLTMIGKALTQDEFLALDVVQRDKILKVSAEAERIMRDKKHPLHLKGIGVNEAVEAAAKKFQKGDTDFLARNVFLNTAESIVTRRDGGEGQAPEAPVSEALPNGFTAKDLNQELDELLSSQKGIDLENATGLGSAYSNFLTNLPGQFFNVGDQETVRARAALLRVSREILVLTMKNDRFAIAEQVILSPLLDKPSLLVDADSIKTKMLRFQEELKIEIARSMRNIKAGINPGRELDKIVDMDRIDSMINQFNLTPPIDTATPEDIKNASPQALSNLQNSVTDSQLRNDPEKLDAMINAQEAYKKKLTPGGTLEFTPEPESTLEINESTEVNPVISQEVQDAIRGMSPEKINSYINQIADVLVNPGEVTQESLINMEALKGDLEAYLSSLSEGQQ